MRLGGLHDLRARLLSLWLLPSLCSPVFVPFGAVGGVGWRARHHTPGRLPAWVALRPRCAATIRRSKLYTYIPVSVLLDRSLALRWGPVLTWAVIAALGVGHQSGS